MRYELTIIRPSNLALRDSSSHLSPSFNDDISFCLTLYHLNTVSTNLI
jgi:hypothetical protein